MSLNPNLDLTIGVGRQKRNFFYEIKRNKALYLMLLPGALILFLYNYLPMFGVLIAFKDFRFHDGNFFSSLIKSEWRI